MPDWLLPMVLAGAVQGLVTWGALRVELAYMRRDIDHAHKRLDGINAGGQWVHGGAK